MRPGAEVRGGGWPLRAWRGRGIKEGQEMREEGV